jgi:hypothetical protein
MSSESGFESFDWRGKRYNTEELRKKFEKSDKLSLII